ncbi:MAG: hypothetical protein A2X23_07510 [Chloroflexi bacterium GWC2_73_18]|nr:MAG: hypothetical protein A2X23_07510 [Chloroflexi bacterium GWC2_73_18]
MCAVAVVSFFLLSSAPSPGTESPSAVVSARPPMIGGTPADEAVFVLLARNVDQDASVVAVDPATGEAAASYAAGHDPAAAVSSGGDRLYLSSGLGYGSNLSVIETSTGQVVRRIGFPDRWDNTLPPYFPTMALAPDGRWLFALRARSVGPERDIYTVAVFDAVQGEFLADELPMAGCIGGLLVPGSSSLDVACPHTGILLSFPALGNGRFDPPSSVQASERFVAGAARLPGSPDVLLVTDAGRVIRVGADGVSVIVVLAEAGADQPQFAGFAVSPDRSRLYVGRGEGRLGSISRIEAYEMATGARSAEVELPAPGWTMRLSRDGERLYVAAHETLQLLVFETRGLRLVATWRMPDRPALVLAP